MNYEKNARFTPAQPDESPEFQIFMKRFHSMFWILAVLFSFLSVWLFTPHAGNLKGHVLDVLPFLNARFEFLSLYGQDGASFAVLIVANAAIIAFGSIIQLAAYIITVVWQGLATKLHPRSILLFIQLLIICVIFTYIFLVVGFDPSEGRPLGMARFLISPLSPFFITFVSMQWSAILFWAVVLIYKAIREIFTNDEFFE